MSLVEPYGPQTQGVYGHQGRDDRELAHGSRWTQTMGAQYIVRAPEPLLFGGGYIEIPMTAQRPQRARLDPRGAPCAEWWTLNVSGSALYRSIQDPGPQRIIGWSEIFASGVSVSQAILRVSWDADEFFMSVGAGQRVSVLAPTISTALLVPDPQARENRNQRTDEGVTTTLPNTTVVDTACNLKVTCSDAPLGDRIARLTTFYDGGDARSDIPSITIPGIGATAPGAPRDYRVPPRARRVQFVVGPGVAPPALGAGPEFLTDQVTRNSRGIVDAWTSRFSPIVDIAGDATLFTLSAFQFPIAAIWELEC